MRLQQGTMNTLDDYKHVLDIHKTQDGQEMTALASCVEEKSLEVSVHAKTTRS